VTDQARPIRVLLVEDNDVYRDSLVFLVGRRGEIEVVDAVPDGRSAVRSWQALAPDVAVVPDVDGGQVAADLRSLTPDAAIVFLSASAGEEEYDAASSAGAALVRKDAGIEALVEAVCAAAGR
jgi:DNA-binding NarL/FixJ family response regulator